MEKRHRWSATAANQAPNPRKSRADGATAGEQSRSTQKNRAQGKRHAAAATETANSDAAQHRADRHARMTEHQLDTAHQLAAAAPPIPRDARARAAVLLRPHPTHHIPERNAA